ncbi:RB1-inducible coiled-coil protein [Ooceraea biroi]|uniref:RB1-inducible coiled-coil protein n=1 Tax=Ooceraea biroi TaxID=2015173 RepID=A0A026WBD8_OOCBI|nr:RB1-inducible coiled-coil protein [Ooceraea biroi]
MEAIERECGVVAAHQVLLMSGGECLEPNARVCSYSAGTDTNPIYLFSKAAIESTLPPTPNVDLQTQIDASLAMPATYQTLCARAHLAQQCCGLAREQTRICERLVHDQHLQQQGWAAVVANLEDITVMFQSRTAQFEQAFVLYLNERQRHMDLLDNFSADLGTLAKIPILPALRAQAEGLLSPDDQPSQSSEPAAEGNGEVLSLLRWISAKDNQSSLEQVADQCSRGLEQFDERLMETLKAEVNAAIDNAKKQDMKEIKGLSERLYALEQLMYQARRIVHEQGELTQGFLQNQSRASNLGDASVLPDLCTSHRRQLLVMLQNHNQLRDIRRRCTKAKEELSMNIYHRLKWIMYVENKMVEVGNKLIIYHESLKRLRRHLEVLQQIHLAPQMYISAVIEVVRRRTFSQAFLVWASNLACQLLTVHSEELARRREFQSKFDGHFLNTLFPGLEDTPPPFATQAPSVFDNGLPKLTADDMESLRSQLPDLALTISTPDLNSITQFFLSKSFTDGNKEKDATSVSTDIPSKEHERTRAPMLSDRGGFESETDTEEFEKIGQAGVDMSKPGVFDGTKQKRQKQLEVCASRSVSPASSTSTNVSPLNSKVADLTTRLSTSSEPGSFQFPSLSAASERPAQLSPLTECVENGAADSSVCLLHRGLSNYRDVLPLEEPHSLSPNPPSLPRSSVMCDGQHQQHQHPLSGSGGSSPSVGVGATDFMGTEFYMDESLPSSLSEHPADGQHQAIVSLLQENLGNTREEVERLRSILKTMKAVVCEELSSLRNELSILRDRSNEGKSDLTDIKERVRVALSLYSQECDRRLQEREQEVTIEHELKMADVKKLMQEDCRNREEEIRTLKGNLMEKEMELAEHGRLVATMRQKLEDEQIEKNNLQTRLHQQLENYSRILEQARIDKEEAVKQTNDERFLEITSLTNSLTQCQKRIQELEENLATARSDQERMVKEATDKFQVEYKAELETIRSRFKLMAASTMERSPSDSSLEKIERTDVIELANHEAILAQTKEDMKVENAMAIRTAVEKERADCMAKLDNELSLAREVVVEKNKEIEIYRMRTAALIEQGKRYKNMIDQLIGELESKSEIRQTLKEKMKSLESDKGWLESKETAEKIMRTVLEHNENMYPLESGMCKGPRYDRLDTSQVDLEEVFKDLESEKYEVEVSESKKVRLETDNDDLARLSRRLEALDNDNKRLSCELNSIRASKVAAEAKVEALVTDKIRLEIELLKEQTKRVFNIDSSVLSLENRDKEMNASVAVVADASSASRDAATITSCNPGDIVLVVWDTVHCNYAVYQESTTLYFLHSDCVDALDVGMNPNGSRKCVLAEVIDKEYCHARKHENRYHVPRGTKFYRVRAKPRDGRALVDKTGSMSKSQLP